MRYTQAPSRSAHEVVGCVLLYTQRLSDEAGGPTFGSVFSPQVHPDIHPTGLARALMMFLAAPLVAAWSLQPCPPPHRLHRSRAPVCSLGSLCTEQTFELNRQLDLGKESEASRSISALHATSIAPLLPAVWSSEFPDREDAIVKLSAVLDELEASSSGPLLTGDTFASCDAQCFPTFCLLSWALPRHFGWTEYTMDALFWKRPRLHAWFDLCTYEEPCREAAANIERELEAIEYWPEISVDVPTNKLRRLARKDL